MSKLTTRTATALLCLGLAACGGGGSNETNVSNPVIQEVQGNGQIKILSNRADLISGGNALLEIIATEPGNLNEFLVRINGMEATDSFARNAEGRLLGLVDGLKLGNNQITVQLADNSVLRTQIINHPQGGPIFSGPQVQPWTCTNDQALDAQCNQPAEFTYKYLPASKLENILTNSDVENQQLADALRPYDPENPPAEEDIAQTTTDNGTTLPFIVQIERGVQNRDRYQIMTLFQPGMEWTALAPQPQWNRKLLIHHGGNVGVTFGPGNPPNGDISGTAPDGAEFATGDSILVAVGRGFVTLSTALANLGHNTNLVTSAESLVMAKEHIVETYGEMQYTIGTGCSGGAIAQQHVANAYPGIYQGIIVQCSYPDVWTTATQFADYNLLNQYFDEVYGIRGFTEDPEGTLSSPEAFQAAGTQFFESLSDSFTSMENPADSITIAQWSLIYGHLPVNPRASDLAFFPRAFPTQDNCPGLNDAAPQYDAQNRPDGLRCGLIDYMKTQFGTRPESVWSVNEEKINRGFGGIPLDNIGVQYGLLALQQGLISHTQFLSLNERIGGFDVDIQRIPERFAADEQALTNAYRTGAINTFEHVENIPIIDLRGADPGIAHDAYHSWQVRARLEAAQGHHDNQVIWFGQFPLAGDSTYSTEALLVMDRWLSQIAADEGEATLPEKVVSNKPAAARDRCLSPQSLYAEDGPFIPLTGNLFYPDPIVPGFDSSQAPTPPAESGLIFDQVANQVCGLNFSEFDPTGESGQLTGPVEQAQQWLVQTRFGTPRTVAGDDIRTINNKCTLKSIDPTDYDTPTGGPSDEFLDAVEALFPDGVCDYEQPGQFVGSTLPWLQYGDDQEAVIGGEPLPTVPEGSRGGWALPAFGLEG